MTDFLQINWFLPMHLPHWRGFWTIASLLPLKVWLKIITVGWWFGMSLKDCSPSRLRRNLLWFHRHLWIGWGEFHFWHNEGILLSDWFHTEFCAFKIFYGTFISKLKTQQTSIRTMFGCFLLEGLSFFSGCGSLYKKKYLHYMLGKLFVMVFVGLIQK